MAECNRDSDSGDTSITSSHNTLFIDTNLGTHLVLSVSNSDTVSDLKKKIMSEHPQCFRNFGDITIQALKVKHRRYFYHLTDSMLVKSAFEWTKKSWILFVDASSLKENVDNQFSSKPDSSNQLALLCVTNSPSGDKNSHLLGSPSKRLSPHDILLLPQPGTFHYMNQIVASNDQSGQGDSSKEVSKDLEMVAKHLSDDSCKSLPTASKRRSSEFDKEKYDLNEGNKTLETSIERQDGNSQVGVNDVQFTNPAEISLTTGPALKKKLKSKKKIEDADRDTTKDNNASIVAPDINASHTVVIGPEFSNIVEEDLDGMEMKERESFKEPGKSLFLEANIRSGSGEVPGTSVEARNGISCHRQVGANDIRFTHSPGEGSLRTGPALKKKRKSKKKIEDADRDNVKDNSAPIFAPDIDASHTVFMGPDFCPSNIVEDVSNDKEVGKRDSVKEPGKTLFLEANIGSGSGKVPGTSVKGRNDISCHRQVCANNVQFTDSPEGSLRTGPSLKKKRKSKKKTEDADRDTVKDNIAPIFAPDIDASHAAVIGPDFSRSNIVEEVSNDMEMGKRESVKEPGKTLFLEANIRSGSGEVPGTSVEGRNDISCNMISDVRGDDSVVEASNSRPAAKKKRKRESEGAGNLSEHKKTSGSSLSKETSKPEDFMEDKQKAATSADCPLTEPPEHVNLVASSRSGKEKKKKKDKLPRDQVVTAEASPLHHVADQSFKEDMEIFPEDSAHKASDAAMVPEQNVPHATVSGTFSVPQKQRNLETVQELVEGYKLPSSSTGNQSGKSDVDNRGKKRAKKSVAAKTAMSSIGHADNFASGISPTASHSTFNDYSTGEAAKEDHLSSQTERMKISKPKNVDTSFLGANGESENLRNEEESLPLAQENKTPGTAETIDWSLRKKAKKNRISDAKTSADFPVQEEAKEIISPHLNQLKAAPKNVENVDEKSRQKTENPAAKSLPDFPIKEKEVGGEELTSDNDRLRQVGTPAKTKRGTKSVKTSFKNQLTGQRAEHENNRDAERCSFRHQQTLVTVGSTQVPSTDTLQGNSQGRPLQFDVDGSALKNCNVIDANYQAELSKGDTDEVNFKDYFVPREHRHEVAPVEKVSEEKRSNRNGKVKKNAKKLVVPSSAISPDPENSLESNINQGSERKSKGRNSNAIQCRESLNYDEVVIQSKSSKVSENGIKAPDSQHIKQIKTITQVAKLADVLKDSMTNSSMPGSPKANSDSSGTIASSSESSYKYLQRKKETERKSNMDRHQMKFSKVSSKKMGEVVDSSRHKKSLFATPCAIFRDGSSDSSEDENGAVDSDASTKTPSDKSSSSGYSDGESKSSLDSPRNGIYGAKGKGGGKSIISAQVSGVKNMTLDMDMILRSSSRFKKAKLTASQSQLEDAESQLVDFVPETQLTM